MKKRRAGGHSGSTVTSCSNIVTKCRVGIYVFETGQEVTFDLLHGRGRSLPIKASDCRNGLRESSETAPATNVTPASSDGHRDQDSTRGARFHEKRGVMESCSTSQRFGAVDLTACQGARFRERAGTPACQALPSTMPEGRLMDRSGEGRQGVSSWVSCAAHLVESTR